MLAILAPSHDVINIAVPSLEREQSMGMVVELTIISRDHIAVKRYKFKHPFQSFSLKTTTLRNEHLQFCIATPTDARENGRRNGFFTADFEDVADDFISSVHSDIVRFAYLFVFHNSLSNYRYNQPACPIIIPVFTEADSLPGTHVQTTISNGNGQAYSNHYPL